MATRGTSDEAIRRGTARPWSFWRDALDDWGAKGKTHSEIARYLGEQPEVSSWWAQALTVRYEQDLGLREVGQNRQGWTVSTQRTFDRRPEQLFQLLVASPALWLGTGRGPLVEASRRRARQLGPLQVKRIAPSKLVRIELEDDGSVLEVHFSQAGPARTAVSFQHARLANSGARETMRRRWRAALDRLAATQ